MKDSNWELVSGDDAHAIEVLNYASQVNVIEALVRLLIHRHGVGDGGCMGYPTVHVLREFHRTATLFLLLRPGEFRGEGEDVSVFKDGKVVHAPPAYPNFQPQLDSFFEELAQQWGNVDHVGAAAFTLWFINWVHPFKNGNGRSARAFCYACIALKLGFVLPGTPTVIDLIMDNRDEYEAALAEADKGFAETGKPTLGRMEGFIEELLIRQLETATT
jgi:Fic family protein